MNHLLSIEDLDRNGIVEYLDGADAVLLGPASR